MNQVSDEMRRACVLSWLDSMCSAKRTLDRAEEMIGVYLSRMDVTAKAYDMAPGQMDPDKMMDKVAGLIELRERWEADVVDLSAQLDEARRIMARSQEREWMWLHYVERRRWGEIAKPLNYTEAAVRLACKRHMVEIYPEIPKRWRIAGR